MEFKKFKLLKKEKVLENPYIPVERHEVEFANGKKGEWFVITNRAAVVVVPVLSDGRVLLQRNYKYGCDEIVTEFCAGMIDEGETPLETARRELREETGHGAKEWISLGTVWGNPTSSQIKYHFFLAKGCVMDGQTDFDDAEQIELMPVKDWGETLRILNDPETLTSCATLAAVERADGYLGRG